MGSFQPDAQEIPEATVVRATLVVDNREAALEETGDLIQPLRCGAITAADIRADLGEIVLGRLEGRRSETEVTLFESVGLAVQDAAAARIIMENAERHGLGQRVSR